MYKTVRALKTFASSFCLISHALFSFKFQVPDLDKVYCDYNPFLKNSSLVSLEVTDFLCPYETDWDDGCDCCPEDSCPCCSVCHKNCQCFRGNWINRKIMVCISTNLTSIPQEFPNFVTEIVLSSNYIKTVQEGAFDKAGTNFLERLDLSDNLLHSIDNKAFGNVSSLEWLMLHNNNLRVLNLSIFDDLPNLKNLSLHKNPWECECTYGPIFQTFIKENYRIIYKPFSIYCTYNGNFTQRQLIEKNVTYFNITREPILDIDFNFCHNRTVHKTVEHRYHLSVAGLATISTVFVFVAFIVILIYKHRLLLRVWAYNRFGARCHKENEENDDKPYDVFLAYALEDDNFVVNNLLQGLEEGPKSYAVRQLLLRIYK